MSSSKCSKRKGVQKIMCNPHSAPQNVVSNQESGVRSQETGDRRQNFSRKS
ncbi:MULTISPECIES: hypothetical protein [unclassified Okeania]|nr:MULTISPECIES: hypothetical protein [unclassified Okeania]NES78225.1 hypothetical protein [Okeania sp. SIO1H4]